MREKNCGRKHNHDPLTRVPRSRWSFGKLRRLLEYKLKRHGIKLILVDEGGTSGTCPVCTTYTKQSGRTYRCGDKDCGFKGAHRDVVGASGILDKSVSGSFTKGRTLPSKVEYSRPRVLTPKTGEASGLVPEEEFHPGTAQEMAAWKERKAAERVDRLGWAK